MKSKDLYNNTIIIFTPDNGAMAGGRHKGHKVCSPLPDNAPFSGHKGNFYQGGIRVPLFIHWPAGIKAPSRSNHLVSTMDILPTVIDAVKGEVLEDIDGKSLLPLLNNPNYPAIHDYLLWVGMHSTAWGFLIEKSTKDHHTERPFAPSGWVVMQDDFTLRFTGKISPGIYYDYMDGRESILELYNTQKDPAETIDLSQEMPERIAQMSKIFYEEAMNLPPPAVWEREKWEELVSPQDK